MTHLETKHQPLVIHHSPCLDGFTAAWAMWLKHPDAEFVPGVYGQDPPDCTGRDVYLLDFSYKRGVMLSIVEVAKSVLVLDHHKTAAAEINPLLGHGVEGIFDMDKSGARLAWEYFHPGVAVPRLVHYVEDRDLWRFSLWGSCEVNAALFSYDYSFEQWSRLSEGMQRSIDGPIGLDMFITAGEAILRKQDKDVRELIGMTKMRRSIGGVMVPCANLPYTLASDAANLMAEGEPFAATYYNDADDHAVFSLRSREGGVDVSEVAKLYGGGGHKHAAGFRIELVNHMLGLYDYERKKATV
jgi:uncharacterized protein